MEQYVDVSSTGHSTAQPRQTIQQNGGQMMKDKPRLSGKNKIVDFISRMNKPKRNANIVSLKSECDEKEQDKVNIERDTKIEVKLRVNPPRIGPYKRDDLESVLGIVPEQSLGANERDEFSYTQDYGRDSMIVIAGFTPTGPAIASHQLEIGKYSIQLLWL